MISYKWIIILLYSPLLDLVSGDECGVVVVSGAPKKREACNGAYTRGHLYNSGKPYYYKHGQDSTDRYLYWHASNSKWYISDILASTIVMLKVPSNATFPNMIEENWEYWNGMTWHEAKDLKLICQTTPSTPTPPPTLSPVVGFCSSFGVCNFCHKYTGCGWCSSSSSHNKCLPGNEFKPDDANMYCNLGWHYHNCPGHGVDCKALLPPSNGYITPNTCPINSPECTLRFTCDPLYHLDGSSSAQCRDGQWLTPAPLCVSDSSDQVGAVVTILQFSIGLFLCFVGFRWKIVTLTLMSYVSVAGLVYISMATAPKSDHLNHVCTECVLAATGIGGIIAGTASYLFIQDERYRIFLPVMANGFSDGFFFFWYLFWGIVVPIYGDASSAFNNIGALWICLSIIFGLAFCAVALRLRIFERNIAILSTSFVGTLISFSATGMLSTNYASVHDLDQALTILGMVLIPIGAFFCGGLQMKFAARSVKTGVYRDLSLSMKQHAAKDGISSTEYGVFHNRS